MCLSENLLMQNVHSYAYLNIFYHTVCPYKNNVLAMLFSFWVIHNCMWLNDRKMLRLLGKILESPYWKLIKFIVPVAFTTTAQDIGEQVYIYIYWVSGKKRNALSKNQYLQAWMLLTIFHMTQERSYEFTSSSVRPSVAY